MLRHTSRGGDLLGMRVPLTGEPLDVVVIGGAQAGLAAGFHLRRSGLAFAILEAGRGRSAPGPPTTTA